MVNPVLLIAVPLGLVFLTPVLSLLSRRAAKFIPPIALSFNLAVSCLLLPKVLDSPVIVSIGGWQSAFSINLVAGPIGVLLAAVIAFVGLLVSIYAVDYIREGATDKYHMLFLLLLTGATGVVLTGDIFNLFVFFEILCISSYALVAYAGDKAGIESAVKYLIQGSVGSSLLLIGIGLLYGIFGTLNMADIARNLESASPISVFVPMALIVSGLGVEAAMFPLNAWLPDAHSSAPSSVSAVLSGIAIEVGLYAMVRIVFTVFGVSLDSTSNFLLFLAVLGILTLLVGEMCAFNQKNIKRMLAYSSIGQMGLIVFALAMATSYAVTGGLFQLVSHTLAKALLFMAAGYMIWRAGSLDISALEGMGRRMPVTCLAFTIGAFSLVGLPPFIGFPSKFLIVRAALATKESLFFVLIGLALLGTVIEAAYFFRIVQVLYFRGTNSSQERKEVPVVALLPIIAFVVLLIGIGIYPKIITDILNSAASDLIDRIHYIGNVLG